MNVETPNLSDYAKSDGESFEEFAEFSLHYQAYKMYRNSLFLMSNNQYQRARTTFYDSLSWFSIMFDPIFPQRCHNIIQKYESCEYKSAYTYEQIEQLKFIRIVSEFTRLLIDASSKNRVKINQDPNRRVELIPVGYGQILSYEHMTLEFYNRLA